MEKAPNVYMVCLYFVQKACTFVLEEGALMIYSGLRAG